MPKNNIKAKDLVSVSIISSSNSNTSTTSSSASMKMKINGASVETSEASSRHGSAVPYLTPEEENRQSRDIISFDMDINSLPSSLQEFCKDVGMDPALVVEHLLLDAYQEILRTLAQENGFEETKNRVKSILESEYARGRISSDILRKARYHDWLQDSDIETIKRLRESYKVLLDEPNEA